MEVRALGRLALTSALIFASQTASALFCGSATNQAHVSAGRAVVEGYVYARANGSNDDMGLYYSDTTTLNESSEGYYEVVTSCGNKGGPEAGYDNHYERDVPTIVDITGNYGVALAGGHFLEGSGGDGFPRSSIVGSSDSINIPAGATVKYAFMYYGGIIGLGNDSFTSGDFTADGLNNQSDVENNGLSFSINGVNQGTFDASNRQPAHQTEVGSQALIGDDVFNASFGTLQGTSTTFWSNRLDITDLLQGKSGNLTFDVSAPEELDVDVNNSSRNGGNDAGTTLYNSCLGAANWGLVVIYEDANEESKQLILKDDIVRAWDYIWFHKGVWNRPKVSFDNHAPMAKGAKVYLMGQTGNPAGTATPGTPYCTCGCGGSFNLAQANPTNKSGEFWSYTLVDPEVTWDDPLHRDSTNGPWNVVSTQGTNGQSLRGNEWTLFQSGTDTFTEFPNLYEGEDTPADNITPVTNEDIADASGDTYAGHPWAGRGDVTYHGFGNDLSVVEIALDDSAIDEGSTSSALYFKGDQKDVFKPQARVTVRFMLLEIPSSEVINQKPEITVTDPNPMSITVGSTFVDPGATADDNEDGDITASIAASCNVNANTIGTYQCTYNVSDSEGLAADEKTRTVNVVADAPPVITIIGANPMTVNLDSNFVDPGANAQDDVDGDLTASIVANCNVNTAIEGSYQCTYSVTDSAGNPASATRDVNVTDNTDNVPPVITILGDNPLTLNQDANFIDPGATAQDNVDGNITSRMTIVCNVNTSIPRDDYNCTYTVSDNAGNETTATRIVIVEAVVVPTCTTVSTTRSEHVNAGRAYTETVWFSTYYYATGSGENIPYVWSTTPTPLHQFDSEPGVWHVGSCPN
ncbi:MAG: DUF5011 domain-containing protein [Cellvibrionaceae bacterium]